MLCSLFPFIVQSSFDFVISNPNFDLDCSQPYDYMRLINTKTLQPTDIQGPQSIRYTILSHCWTDSEEAKFRGITDPANLRQTTRFAKIRTCQLAKERVRQFHQLAPMVHGLGKSSLPHLQKPHSSCEFIVEKHSDSHLLQGLQQASNKTWHVTNKGHTH